MTPIFVDEYLLWSRLWLSAASQWVTLGHVFCNSLEAEMRTARKERP